MKKFYAYLMSSLFIPSLAIGNPVEFIKSTDVINAELSKGAVIRKEAGFETDFLVLHCLVKLFQPSKLFEVGTCEGYGTLIMANACSQCSIISLDLPLESPPFYLTADRVGFKCDRPFEQVFGDSLTYDYSQHFPVDAWFFDGAHDYGHVKHETQQALGSNPAILIYHDTDIPEVLKAVVDALEGTEYQIYRVEDTRVSFAVKESMIYLLH